MHCVVATILSSGDPCCGVQNSTGGPKIAQQPREDGERGPARRRTCRTAEAATPAHHRHINTRGGSALRQLVHEPDKMKQGRKWTNLNNTHGKEKGSRSASGRLTSPLHSVSYNATSAEVWGLICCLGSVQHLEKAGTGHSLHGDAVFITKLAMVLSCYLQLTSVQT